MSTGTWHVVDEERAILWREYEFRKNARSTMLAFRGADGLVVVSPGPGLESGDYDALSKYGEVRALIANNTFHHLGQPAWRDRFPKAESYAAKAALPVLGKKHPNIPFRPLEELPLPAHVRCHALPGYKTHDALISVGTQKGSLWYTSDLLINMQAVPPPPVRWLFTLTGSAPGYRLFRLSTMFFVNDKPALRQRMAALVAEDPPAIVVPAHGPAYVADTVAADTKAQLEKL